MHALHEGELVPNLTYLDEKCQISSDADLTSSLSDHNDSMVAEGCYTMANPVYETFSAESFTLQRIRTHINLNQKSKGGSLKYVLPEFSNDVDTEL